MNRTFVAIASVLGFLGVGAGAFGAHALRASLGSARMETWNTGAHYHLVMAVALLALALSPVGDTRAGRSVGALWTVGILIFAGSLYLLAATGIRWLGAITPLGGVCFLAGWAFLAWQSLKPPATPS